MASPLLDRTDDTPDWRDPAVRLAALLDPGSLRMLAPFDNSGAYAAQGTVGGSRVVAFASDPQKMGGAMGSDGCRHIVDAIDTAVRERVPVIGLWHSGGARLAEGVEALDAVGQSSPRWCAPPGGCRRSPWCSARPPAAPRTGRR